MEDDNSRKFSNDYKDTLCPIQCDVLLRENQSILNEFFEFCSARLVLPILDFNKKQLHLSGSLLSNIEAEKRFLELQNQLLIEKTKNLQTEPIYWWYEAWDATWQLYSPTIINEIEYHYKANQFNFTIHNETGEKVTIDLNTFEEIYGKRIKRIRRSKHYIEQPSTWTLTPFDLERFPLDINSKEYFSVKTQFDLTMAGRYKMFISIERIQNLRLFKQFHLLHEEFLTRYNEVDGTMRFLYHGCPESAAKNIIERGFNRSYCGVNGCVYGRGVYFSVNASYSDGFAIPNGRNEKRIFHSRVLIGRSMLGHSKMCEPGDGYDTTTDGNHIFVCYQDSQVEFVGLIGNGINILVFSSVQNYRKTPAIFYFLIASAFNISYLLINLPIRIVIAGFGIDVTTTSLLYYKLRPFFLTTLCLISLNCSCLATIDQFFTTSQNSSLRRLSSIKWAHRIVVIIILVWCIHGIPFLIYYGISPITHSCISINTTLAIYFPAIYILTLNCAIPAVIMIVFAYLAYRNIQKTTVLAQQQADRQLTRMVLINVLLVITSYVPYGIYNSYLVIVSNDVRDKNTLLLENLFGVIVSVLCYSYFAASCYMFLISSSRFRREVKEKLCFWRTQRQTVPLKASHP